MPELHILRLIASWPNLVITNPKGFEMKVAAVKEMGINPSRYQFFCSNCCKNSNSASLWERKLNFIRGGVGLMKSF